MSCYFQGCCEKGITKEHIPPRSFFPDGEKDQLLTVKSCERHNNLKSKNDLYALAQICMNASPSNRAREVFKKSIYPQLHYGNGALRKALIKDAIASPDGSVSYRVDTTRLDEFFSALSCGLIYKTCGSSLPSKYNISHIYHNLKGNYSPERHLIIECIEEFYSGQPMAIFDFGRPDLKNKRIYNVKIFGIADFLSSITIVHRFFGVFKVTSMLSCILDPRQSVVSR